MYTYVCGAVSRTVKDPNFLLFCSQSVIGLGDFTVVFVFIGVSFTFSFLFATLRGRGGRRDKQVPTVLLSLPLISSLSV